LSQNIEQSSPKPRIESLSDMIFGLALSIGALSLMSKPPGSPELIQKYRLLRNSFFFAAALFLISVLPQFWTWSIKGTPFRFYFWLVPIGIFWIRRFLENETKEIGQ